MGKGKPAPNLVAFCVTACWPNVFRGGLHSHEAKDTINTSLETGSHLERARSPRMDLWVPRTRSLKARRSSNTTTGLSFVFVFFSWVNITFSKNKHTHAQISVHTHVPGRGDSIAWCHGGNRQNASTPVPAGQAPAGAAGGGVLKDVPWTPRSHSKERIVQCVWTTAGTQDAV